MNNNEDTQYREEAQSEEEARARLIDNRNKIKSESEEFANQIKTSKDKSQK